MSRLSKRVQADRSKIDMQDAVQMKCWLKELGVSEKVLRNAIEKIGNSVAAIRKEIASDEVLS